MHAPNHPMGRATRNLYHMTLANMSDANMSDTNFTGTVPERSVRQSQEPSGDVGAVTVGEPSARSWTQILDQYRHPSIVRSLGELAATFIPLILFWGAAFAAYKLGYWWLSLLIAVPAAVFIVRMFLIQHDCGHGSFLPYQKANDWIGRFIGVLTMTPYDFWRRTHAIHHSTTGNLDRRGIGDVDTLTVNEYLSRSWWGRLRYRLYRNPLVMFGIGPAYLFFLQHRLPVGLMRAGWLPWISTQATNAGLALLFAGLMWLLGWKAFLFVHVPIMLIAASIGVWLFYVQHQFESTFWSDSAGWSFKDAALQGSSHYDLPPVLRWLTANIGIHHIHHLSSKIPFYRLNQVLCDHPALEKPQRLSLLDSLGCIRLALWDEERGSLVPFKAVRRR
jgi:omega-6 fatty acid desaturase (delta-12 desaturase)